MLKIYFSVFFPFVNTNTLIQDVCCTIVYHKPFHLFFIVIGIRQNFSFSSSPSFETSPPQRLWCQLFLSISDGLCFWDWISSSFGFLDLSSKEDDWDFGKGKEDIEKRGECILVTKI